jgi:bacterioferritin (cytochrome b1)
MAEHAELIGILNEAVSLEYTAVIQYNQHSVLVTGRDRVLFEGFFKDSAQESLQHAKMWAERIVYLGGVPSVEVGDIRQSSNVTEMLEMDLELEQRAVEVYTRAHAACKHQPTVYMLENHILDEDQDVEKIKKMLGKVNVAQAAPGERRVASGRR